jgi:Phosphodiester glycosidase
MRDFFPQKTPFLIHFSGFQAFLGFLDRSPVFLADRSKSRLHRYPMLQHKNQSYALLSISLLISLWVPMGSSAFSATPPKKNPASSPTPKTTIPKAVTPKATTPKVTAPKSGLPVRNLQQPVASSSALQIVINGQTHGLPWMQWSTDRGQRLALPDGVLKKLFNVEFLSTNDATRQPIGWFRNDQAPSAVLNVLPAKSSPSNPNDRFLDVTDWLSSLGWQVQVQGSQLTLTPPLANLKSLRQAETSNNPAIPSDRIVLELDRPTNYQIDAQSQEWILRLEAQVKAETIAAFKPSPSKKIASLSLTEGPQTILKLGIPLSTRPTVTQLNNPPRIVIDIGTTSNYSHDILWQPGIRWRQQMLTIGNDSNPLASQPITVISFELEPRTPGLKLRPIMPAAVTPQTISGTSTLLQTAQQAQSVVAINGGFFNRINQLPLGLVQIDGQVRSGPILNRGVMAWNPNGTVEFDRYSLQETATIGAQSFLLTHLNSAYVQAGIARYTPAWGGSYQTLSDGEVVMEVVNNLITTKTDVPTAGTTVPIPSNGYLLTFRSNRTAAASVTIGNPVTLNSAPSNPKIASAFYAVGGGPLLIKDRQVVLDAAAEKFSPAFIRERAARSAIGRLSNGNLLIVSVQPTLGRGGPTLTEMTQIMQQLGAIDALNFDGGSSTTLHLGGFGGYILDRPSRSSARVHNAIGIFLE